MDTPLLLLLVAIAAPGVFALRMWDFCTQQKPRGLWTTIAMGAFLGLSAYGVAQAFGWLDLRLVLDEKQGVNVAVALEPRNVGAFISLTLVLIVVAVVAARATHTSRGERLAHRVFGRTVGGSMWTEVMRSNLNARICIRTKDGEMWTGMVDHVGTNYDDEFIALADPLAYGAETASWHDATARSLVFKLDQVDRLLTGYRLPEPQPQQRGDDDERRDDATVDRGPARSVRAGDEGGGNPEPGRAARDQADECDSAPEGGALPAATATDPGALSVPDQASAEVEVARVPEATRATAS